MGKAVAGYVTAQTKSGSNEFHGSGFWFRRTDANQARDPFTQYAPDPTTGNYIPSTKWQQFGGSIGGPIIKNKLFFFGDYQGQRYNTGLPCRQPYLLLWFNPRAVRRTGFCNLSQYLGVTGGGGGERLPAGSTVRSQHTGTLAREQDALRSQAT